MNDEDKPKRQLVNELTLLRERVVELEKAEGERRSTEGLLRNSQERLNLALKSSMAGTWDRDIAADKATWDEHLHALFGLVPDTFSGKLEDFLGMVHPDDRARVRGEMAAAMTGDSDYSTIYRVVWPDSSLHFIADRGKVYRDSTGQAVRMIGVALDVSERKQAEEALKESRQQFADIINFLPDATFVIDREGKVIFWNRAIEEMTGITAADILGKGNYEYALPFYGKRRPILIDLVLQQRGEVEAGYASIAREESVIAGEVYLPALRGRETHLSGKACLLHDSKGNVIGAIETIRDITRRTEAEKELGRYRDHLEELVRKRTAELAKTNEQLTYHVEERRRVEEALRESEAKYRNIFDNATEGIYQTTPDGRYLSVNPAFARMFGFASPEEMISETTDIGQQLYVHPEDREKLKQLLVEDGRVEGFETQVHRRDGRVIWISINARAVRDETGAILLYEGTNEDITDRKQAEEALRKSKDQYDTLAANIAVGVYLLRTTPTGGFAFEYVSPQMANMLGLSAESILTDPQVAFQPLHPDEAEAFVRLNRESIEAQQSFLWEGRMVVRGATRWFQVQSRPETLDTGDVLWHGIVADITERHRAEAALRESQRQMADIVNFLPDATFVIDRTGKVILWNRAIEDMTGVSAAEMIGKNDFEYALPFYGKRVPLLANLVVNPQGDIENRVSLFRREKDILEGEIVVPYLKGEERILSARATPIYNLEGEVVVAIESIRDTTEQKLMQRALSYEHQKLSSILDGSPISSFVIDREHRVTAWNIANEYFTGISKEAVLGKPLDLSPLFKDKVPPSLAALVLEMTDEEIISCYAHKGIWKSKIHPEAFESTGSIWIKGKELIMAIQATRLRDAAGNVVGAIQCAEDITEQRRAEEALRESEERYRTALESSNDGVVIIQDGRYVYLNQKFLDTLGRTRDEMMGKVVGLTLDPDDRATVRDYYDEYQKGLPIPSRFEMRVSRRDGTIIDAEVSPVEVRYEGQRSILAYFRNITYRKRMEEALRQSEQKYRDVFNATSDALFIHDMTGNILDVNERMCAMFEYHRTLALTRSLNDLSLGVSPYSEIEAFEKIRQSIEEGPQVFEWQCRRSGGQGFWCEVALRAYGIGGETRVVASVREITERKHAEEALRESEAKYRRIVNTANEGIWSVDENFATTFVNTRMVEMLGYDESEMIGRPVEWFMFEEDLANLREKMCDRRTGISDRYERRYRHKDGRSVWFILSVTPVADDKDGSFKGSFAMATDITERKRAEEERLQLEQRLHQAEKAESLGRMAGAIAHHFNNLFGALMGRLELALGDLHQAPRPRRHLAEAMKASQRAADISRLMLTYLGQTVQRKEPCNLLDAVRQTLVLLRPSLPQGVHVNLELPPGAIMIQGDKAHIEQALTNLLHNAGEAVGDGDGLITVAVDVMTAEQVRAFRLFPSGWEPADKSYACISMADTGSGFGPAIMERIFDPFFSTKFAGRGLGLAVVLGIVRAHGGALAVESQAGQGSMFRVFLPLLARQTPYPNQEAAIDFKPVKRGGLVLAVEDDPVLCEMAEAMLKELGYEVMVAGDGHEALDMFRERRDEVRVVLLDQSISGMNGWAILAALRTLRPDIPVILASGYDQAQVMGADHPEQPQVFLHKPYHMRDLEAALDTAQKVSPTPCKGTS